MFWASVFRRDSSISLFDFFLNLTFDYLLRPFPFQAVLLHSLPDVLFQLNALWTVPLVLTVEQLHFASRLRDVLETQILLGFGRLDASHEGAGPVTFHHFQLVVVGMVPALAQNAGVSLLVQLDFFVGFGLFTGFGLGVEVNLIYD